VVDPWYWASVFGIRYGGRNYQSVSTKRADADDFAPVEPVTDNLKSQIASGECVDIRGLCKGFDTSTGRKMAVDGLNLTMFSGQITALLGHNGAGKSTTIAMLTGLTVPDGGSAMIEGYDIAHDMAAVRTSLGVCPQHDILFPLLTVEEHLAMYARFKGCPRSELKQEVEKMILSVGLTEKRKVYSKYLSGGQKRKLSVGIAFIGKSRVVFLDEPTSGMDPYSRRFTWNVIRQHKEGRVVVLTTHFMDEADLLGDRIAIMGDGKLRCCGSSLFLKQKFGVGYNMTVEKVDANKFDSRHLQDVVCRLIPDAAVLTDVGTEMTFQLPFSSSGKFQRLFETFDESLQQLGIQSYGMSVTTLEEVFLKVAEGTATHAAAAKGKAVKDQEKAKQNQPASSEKKNDKEVLVKDAESHKYTATNFKRVDENDQWKMFGKHFHALLVKRYLYFTRDIKAWVFQFMAPVILVIIGVIIMEVAVFNNPNQKSLLLDVGMLNGGIYPDHLPTPYSNASVFSFNGSSVAISHQNQLIKSFQSYTDYPMIAANCSTIACMSQKILDIKSKYKASNFGAYTLVDIEREAMGGHFSGIQYLVHANFTCLHCGPLFSALMGDALVRSYNSSASLKTRLHPLPQTQEEKTTSTSFSLTTLIDFILFGIAFCPASYVGFVVREKEVKSKYQQLVSGVSILAYWLSTWLWDLISYQLTMWMIIIIIAADSGKTKTMTKDGGMGCIIGLFILFGFAATSFSYMMSFLFRQAAVGQVVSVFAFFILGLVLGIVGIFLRIFSTTSSAYDNGIRYIFALFPPFCLADGLLNLALNSVWSPLELGGSKTYSTSDWKITGLGLTFLAWESVIYMALTVLIDYSANIPSVQRVFIGSAIPNDNTVRDEDVLAEEKRVETADPSLFTILVKNVKKVYPGGKYAVRGVSLAIPNGECFGLLGINGAGKSTTLSMLTGETPPTSGEAFLNGLDLVQHIHACRRHIGYCPQFDALFDLLTGREHLTLYARVKGIEEEDVARVVDDKVKEMALTEYADRAAGFYSGGNKRKLSVAMAMIGEPSIVFLDGA